jgi:hypothetical protein
VTDAVSAGLAYDTGALVAAERDDRLTWALHHAALKRGIPPVVPAGVLAEGWRGGPQPKLSMFLRGCHVQELTQERARAVGALAAQARHNDIVDVSVVELAIRYRLAVLTSDPVHIKKIADAAAVSLTVQSV